MRTATMVAGMLAGLALMASAGCDQGAQRETLGAPPATTRTAPEPAPAPTPKPAPARSSASGGWGATSGSGLAVLKKSGPDQVFVGEEFRYQIAVSNTGDKPLDDVVVTETLPAAFEMAGSAPQATLDGGEARWALGTLAARETKTITVTGSLSRTGGERLCAHVTYRPPDVCLAVRAVRPALEVTKTGPAEVLICEPIPYTVTVHNTGDGTATNVHIADRLPQGLATQDGKTSVAFDAGDLGPGQAKRATYTVKASKAGTFTNTAVATADRGLKAERSHQVVVREPVLKVTKTGPAMRYVGRNAAYEMTVANTGDGPARQTVLTDTLPGGMALVSADAGGREAGGKVTWNLGTLEPKQSKTVSLTLKATEIGTMRNVARATATCAEAHADATTQVTGIAAILLEVVDLEDPIEVGSNETYVITVTNQGSAVGTNIRVTCTLPEEQQYVSSDGPTQASVAGRKITFAPLAQLAPHAKAVYRVLVKGAKAGDVRFAADLVSDQMTSPAGETESTHIYE